MSFDALRASVSWEPSLPPAREAYDWQSTESELGFQLPSDYKAAVDYFGAGLFNSFIYFHLPSSRPDRDLISYSEFSRDVLTQLSEYEELPYAIDKLFPWGSTINGDVCYWSMEGSAEQWNVVIHDSGSRWFYSDASCTSFVQGILTQEIDCPIFPASQFFSGVPTFAMYDT